MRVARLIRARIWSIKVRELTVRGQFRPQAPGCRLLRLSISLIAPAIWSSWTTILRRCASWTRSRSSIKLAQDLRFQPVDDLGRKRQAGGNGEQPGSIADSASLITSPLTTAAIRLASVSGCSVGAACARMAAGGLDGFAGASAAKAAAAPPTAPRDAGQRAHGARPPGKLPPGRNPRRGLGISGTPEFTSRDSRIGRSS